MFLCPICSPIYLYRSPVMLCCHFNVKVHIAFKAGGLTCHKTRFNPSFFFKCSVPSQEYGTCYIIVRLCVCYILTLCFCCVVCFLLYLSVNSHYYKMCHRTFPSPIHVFSFDVIFIILIEFYIRLSSFLCVLHFNVVVLLLYVMLFPQF